MPTSGLVITLKPSQALASEASKALDRLPGVTLGEPVDGRFLPATIEADQATTTETVRSIERITGVSQVNITWIGIDPPDAIPSRPTIPATREVTP